MPFPQIEPYKKAWPKFAGPLSSLETYLDGLLKRPALVTAEGGRRSIDITTKAVARQLEVDEGFALILLDWFKEAGVLTYRYDAYCPRLNERIAIFSEVNELPDHLDCSLEAETSHSIYEYFIDLVFMLMPASSDAKERTAGS